jgi:hypothetical protein
MRGEPTMRVLVTCGALVIALFAATALGDDPPGQTTAAAKSAYSNKLICKREQVTGSMIPKRVCKTQEQIDQEHEQQKAYAEEMRRSGTSSPVTVPGPLPGDTPRG